MIWDARSGDSINETNDKLNENKRCCKVGFLQHSLQDHPTDGATHP